MKKIVALLLALTMAVSMAACGQDTTDPTTAPSEETTAPSEETTAPSEESTAPSDPAAEPSTETTESSETTEPSEPKAEIYNRDSYSVSDDQALAHRETVVATMGDKQLTNGMLQVYYWMDVFSFLNQYGAYAYYYGLDYTQPLDGQPFMDEEGTWQHFFLGEALNVWTNYQALVVQAEKEGIPLDADTQAALDNMAASMEESRVELGYATLDEMIQADAGPGCTAADYMAYQEVFYRSYSYYNHLCSTTTFTDAQVESWFGENKDALAEQGITKDAVGYDVRHILVLVAEDATDADWEKCEADAQALLDAWLSGDATEDSFATMAQEHSEDPGSAENGGLYAGLTADTNFVQPFKDWYLDESRVAGDYGLVKSDYGYHIMYFSGSGTIWQDYCRDAMTEEAVTGRINAIVEDNPATIDYEKISLGVVDLNEE